MIIKLASQVLIPTVMCVCASCLKNIFNTYVLSILYLNLEILREEHVHKGKGISVLHLNLLYFKVVNICVHVLIFVPEFEFNMSYMYVIHV